MVLSYVNLYNAGTTIFYLISFYVNRYLLYNVNVGEGFNLRRDVYVRVANLVRKLSEEHNWVLVSSFLLLLVPLLFIPTLQKQHVAWRGEARLWQRLQCSSSGTVREAG